MTSKMSSATKPHKIVKQFYVVLKHAKHITVQSQSMGSTKTRAYIGIGSNLGDRKANIKKAIGLVKSLKGVEVKRVSSIYETEPMGGPPQGHFLNGVFEIETTLGPFGLLKEFQDIEKRLGRIRKMRNGPRTVDLDILLFDDEKIDAEDLKIPHPRMREREFVLRGLRELKHELTRTGDTNSHELY